MAAPNLTEIEYVIQELKARESSYENYLLLAAFCICRDELMGVSRQPSPIAAHSMAAEPIAVSRASDTLVRYGDSEFLSAVDGKAPQGAWKIMDRLMTAIHEANPKLYAAFLEQMRQL